MVVLPFLAAIAACTSYSAAPVRMAPVQYTQPVPVERPAVQADEEKGRKLDTLKADIELLDKILQSQQDKVYPARPQ